MKKRPQSFLLPYRLGNIPGSKKQAIVAIHRPGMRLRSRDGQSEYEVQPNGAIRRLTKNR